MPARTAVEAAKEVSKAVSNDIAVFRTKFDVETGKGRKKRLTPVEAELHINPVSILFAAAAGLAGALFATVAWHGVSVPNPLGPPVVVVQGMKDTGFGKDISSWWLRQKLKRQGAEAVNALSNLTQEEKDRVVQDQIGDTNCQLLNREWVKAKRRGDTEAAAEFFLQAQEANCPWTR